MMRFRLWSIGVLCLLSLLCLAACSPGLTPDEKKDVQSEQEQGVVGFVKTILSRTFFGSSLRSRSDRVFQGHTSIVWSVDFSPDGKNLATAQYDQAVLLFDRLP